MAGEMQTDSPGQGSDRRHDLKLAAFGGLAAATILFGGLGIVGWASTFEARRLLEAVLPTVRFAASAYVSGGAAVLALMLTLLTFSISHDLEFRSSHYKRIRDISSLTTAVIIGSVLLLMFLSFPLDEADVEGGGYTLVYYLVLGGAAITGGVFISVMLMLLYAVRGLVGVAQRDPAASQIVSDFDAEVGNDDDR